MRAAMSLRGSNPRVLTSWILGLALISCTAHAAVMVDSGGRGQVLIFPYYTVNAGEQTLLSIVNPSASAKAVKLRFRESLDGREALSLNLYLGAFDVWTAAVFTDGEELPARLLSRDSSCIVPVLSEYLADGTGYASFSTTAFTDGASQAPTRTREGYFEAIEMGTLAAGSASDRAVTQVDGAPRDCAAIAAAWLPGGYWTANPQTDLLPPSGDLLGGASVIHIELGTAYNTPPTALSGFSVVSQHTSPTSPLPDLSSAITKADRSTVESMQVIDGKVYRSEWPQARAIDAVSALLMRANLQNQYDTNPAIGARSDWIMTFPTKRHYADPLLNGGSAIAPFTTAFNAVYGACERINHTVYDREERRPVGIISFPNEPFDCVCHSTAQLQFNRGAAVQYPNNGCRLGYVSTSFATGAFANGHLNMGISGNGHTMRPDLAGRRYIGLPVIGFWKLRYQDAASGHTRFYSETKPHGGQAVCTAATNTVCEAL